MQRRRNDPHRSGNRRFPRHAATKLTLQDGKLDYNLALRSAALKLTGKLPTLAEIKRLQTATDQTTAYSQIIDTYISRPTFNQQILKFWKDTFKMGGMLPVAAHGCGQRHLRLRADLRDVSGCQGQPFTNLLTADTGTCRHTTPAPTASRRAPAPTRRRWAFSPTRVCRRSSIRNGLPPRPLVSKKPCCARASG